MRPAQVITSKPGEWTTEVEIGYPNTFAMIPNVREYLAGVGNRRTARRSEPSSRTRRISDCRLVGLAARTWRNDESAVAQIALRRASIRTMASRDVGREFLFVAIGDHVGAGFNRVPPRGIAWGAQTSARPTGPRVISSAADPRRAIRETRRQDAGRRSLRGEGSRSPHRNTRSRDRGSMRRSLVPWGFP